MEEFASKEVQSVILKTVWITTSRLAHVQKDPDTTLCDKTNSMFLKVLDIRKFIPNKLCKRCLIRLLTPNQWKSVLPAARVRTIKSTSIYHAIANPVTRKILQEIDLRGYSYSQIRNNMVSRDSGRTAYYLLMLTQVNLLRHKGTLYTLTHTGLLARGICQLLSQIETLSIDSIEDYKTNIKTILLIGSEHDFLKSVIRQVINEVKNE